MVVGEKVEVIDSGGSLLGQHRGLENFRNLETDNTLKTYAHKFAINRYEKLTNVKPHNHFA